MWVGGLSTKGPYRGAKVAIAKVEMNFIYKNWHLTRFVVANPCFKVSVDKKEKDLE